MLKEFVEKISSLSGLQVEEIEGLKWASRTPHLVLPPAPEPLNTATLSSLLELCRDYLKGDADGKRAGTLLIHVEETGVVSFKEKGVDKFGRRRKIGFVDIMDRTRLSLVDGQRYSVEDFVLKAQRSFINDEQLATILDLTSRISVKEESDLTDNGITQNVAARSGVHLSEVVTVKNPISLRPYSTFPEVEQEVQAKRYIFRIHRTKGGGEPTISLSSIDSAMWDLDVVKKIKAFVSQQVPEVTVI
jgi:hypothetical protein